MISRLAFPFIAVFWITMNVLLWRAEFGSHHGGLAVPPDLVWRKILTAPDTSSLNVFQDGQRIGFCEFATSVEQEMAKLDESSLPPEGVAMRAGYQIRLNGNVSLGDFTNRMRFDGHLNFSAARAWRELTLRVSTHAAAVEIHSLETNQNFHFKISGDTLNTEGDVRFADLQNPGALLRSITGGFGGGLLGSLDLPLLPPALTASAPGQGLHWEARRDHLMLGHDAVSVYRLETQVLQNHIVIYASTLGEIMRVELPGGITATLDTWGKP
jgi:hypothetical protein